MFILNENQLKIVCYRLKVNTGYNTRFVYCREFAPGTVSLRGDWARGDDSKQNRYYKDTYILLGDKQNVKWGLHSRLKT